jgi:putative ABC transport system permease protein
MMTELRHAFRTLFRSPGFTVIAVISLALGIGANVAIFSLLNALALRTLAAPQPYQLATLSTIDKSGARGGFSYADFEQIRAHQQSLSGLFVWEDQALRTIEVDGVLIPAGVLIASDGFAETIRMRPVVGRDLIAGDSDVAVLGFQLWKRYFNGSIAALGKTIRVQGKPCTIVGVAPEDFTTLEAEGPVDVIVPATALVSPEWLRSNPASGWDIIGRLKPGVTPASAAVELESVWRELRPGSNAQMKVESAARGTGFNFARGRFTFPLEVLMAFVGVLLLLTSVNLATLSLARANARQQETAIRLALGASSMRIFRQYLLEGLLLTCAGVLIGTICARWVSHFLSQFIWVGNTESIHEVPMDGKVLVFAAAVAVMVSFFFGLITAVRALKAKPSQSLRGGYGYAPSARSGKLLIVIQVAASFVLVVAAALFTGTLRNLKSIPLGFDSTHVLGMMLTHRPDGYKGIDPLSYYSQLFDRLERIPGVISVSASTFPPVMPPFFSGRKVEANGATVIAQDFYVAPGYFETMQIPLEAGREFSFNDTGQSSKVTIISESLARKLFSSTDVVGKSVTLSREQPVNLVIAGVVRDSYVGSLQAHNPLQLFTSVFQTTRSLHDPYLLVRLRAAPSGLLVQQLGVELQGLGREYPIRTETMDQAIGRALTQERLMASLSGGFGLLALLLAAVGLYGLMTYSVTRRTREIGIRMALGAHPLNIARMLVSESLLLVVAGFILSLPVVYAGSKVVSKMLYGLRPLDVTPLAVAALVLLVTSMIAVCLPVRRAANLDPIVSLRNE